MNKNIRERLNDATAGRPGGKPVYAVYDWFVEHRPHIDCRDSSASGWAASITPP